MSLVLIRSHWTTYYRLHIRQGCNAIYNRFRLLSKTVMDMDFIALLNKSNRMAKEFQTFFTGGGPMTESQQGMGPQSVVAMSSAAASSQIMIENCMKLEKR